MRRGSRCNLDPGASPVSHIRFHAHHPSLLAGGREDDILQQPNHPSLGYARLTYDPKTRLSPQGETSLITSLTIHWRSDLSYAPIELRVVAPSAQLPLFQRWIVVQLPVIQARRAPVKPGPSIVYGDGVKPFPSGWVCYLSAREARVYVGPRVFGRPAPGSKVPTLPASPLLYSFSLSLHHPFPPCLHPLHPFPPPHAHPPATHPPSLHFSLPPFLPPASPPARPSTRPPACPTARPPSYICRFLFASPSCYSLCLHPITLGCRLLSLVLLSHPLPPPFYSPSTHFFPFSSTPCQSTLHHTSL